MQGRPIFRGKFAKITHKSLDWALYASAVTPIVFSLTQRVYSDTNMSMSGLLVSFSTNFSGFHTGRLWKRATVAWGGRKYFLPWLDELLFRFRLCFCAIFSGENVHIRPSAPVAIRRRKNRKIMQAPRKRCVDLLFAVLKIYDLRQDAVNLIQIF